MLATARDVASERGAERPGRARNRAVEVGEEGALFEWCLSGTAAVAMAAAREVIGVVVVALPISIRASLAEGRDREHHEIRVVAGERVVVQAEAREGAGVLTLDQDVGAGGELAQLALSGFRRELEHDGFFLGVQEMEEAAALWVGAIVLERPPASGDVAGRRLDLDDAGARFDEKSSAVGRGDAIAELDHREPLEQGAGIGVPHRGSVLLCREWGGLPPHSGLPRD